LNTVSGLKRWYSPSRRHWYSPPRRAPPPPAARRTRARAAAHFLGDHVDADAADPRRVEVK
jgi:hypothetical protein